MLSSGNTNNNWVFPGKKKRETRTGDMIISMWLCAVIEGQGRHWESSSWTALPGDSNSLQVDVISDRELAEVVQRCHKVDKARKVILGRGKLVQRHTTESKAHLEKCSTCGYAYWQWGELCRHMTQWNLHHINGFNLILDYYKPMKELPVFQFVI